MPCRVPCCRVHVPALTSQGSQPKQNTHTHKRIRSHHIITAHRMRLRVPSGCVGPCGRCARIRAVRNTKATSSECACGAVLHGHSYESNGYVRRRIDSMSMHESSTILCVCVFFCVFVSVCLLRMHSHSRHRRRKLQLHRHRLVATTSSSS